MPEDLLELLEVPGVGVKTLKLAYDRLKVRTKEHNVRLRDIAKAMGLKLSEYGLFKADTEERIGGSTEE